MAATSFISRPSMSVLLLGLFVVLLAGHAVSLSAPRGKRDNKEISLEEFREQVLKAHNEKRKKHGVPPLKLSDDLNKKAQKYAEELLKADEFQYSTSEEGENIDKRIFRNGPDLTGQEVVDGWYREVNYHNFDEEYNGASSKFSQVVWKDTKEIGVGRAKDGKGKIITVVNYRPAGNIIGEYKDNVLPAE